MRLITTIISAITTIIFSLILMGCEIIAGSGCVVSMMFSSSADEIENIDLPDAKVGMFYQVKVPYHFYYLSNEQNESTPKIINGLTVELLYEQDKNNLTVSGIPITAGEFELAHSVDIIHPSMCSSGKDKYYIYKLDVIN